MSLSAAINEQELMRIERYKTSPHTSISTPISKLYHIYHIFLLVFFQVKKRTNVVDTCKTALL